jgi:uncharacterized membrane protein YfcA
MNIATVLVLSILAGGLGALTGLGGGSILIPVLAAMGVPIQYAIAASMVAIIATSSASAASYVRHRLSNVRAAFYLEMFTITGAIVGATITTLIEPKLLYFFFAAFLTTSFFGIHRHSGDSQDANVVQDRAARWLSLEGSYYDEALGREVSYKMTRPLLGGVGMFIAGLAAGMLGIGAGAFKVSVHEIVLRMPSKVSSATSNFIIGMTALAGASVYFASGYLYLSLAAPIAVGSSIGAAVGGRILNRMSHRTLRFLFLAILVYLIGQMVYTGLRAP